ncbi:hypothetical protein PUN28_007364 [Cardiocondyla obscurior]|uniref:Uncharacterized protein n=1 Tax=Cardiocondyla obscurior TaxID=286306 RepID=A0AAW2G8R9_9HYME
MCRKTRVITAGKYQLNSPLTTSYDRINRLPRRKDSSRTLRVLRLSFAFYTRPSSLIRPVDPNFCTLLSYLR